MTSVLHGIKAESSFFKLIVWTSGACLLLATGTLHLTTRFELAVGSIHPAICVFAFLEDNPVSELKWPYQLVLRLKMQGPLASQNKSRKLWCMNLAIKNVLFPKCSTVSITILTSLSAQIFFSF
jgi:hypothetical protein